MKIETDFHVQFNYNYFTSKGKRPDVHADFQRNP